MKKKYFEPELEIVKFGVEDIITTSFTGNGEIEGNGGNGTDYEGGFPDDVG